jgi:hypothetical protein
LHLCVLLRLCARGGSSLGFEVSEDDKA